MELVDRYLQAIEFWLPKGQKRDIIAELSEDIHSQLEEQETQLGRPLSEEEIEAFLKRRGAPILVANRYLPQRYLIGPVLFPIYWFVVRVVVAIYCTVIASVYLLSYRAVHPAAGWREALLQTLGTVWASTVLGLTVITVIFVILEWVEPKTHFIENFKPRKLPKVRNPLAIPKSTAIAELAVNLAILPWWLVNAGGPKVLNFITLSPSWTYFYWGFAALTGLNVVLAAFNLVNRHWTKSTVFLRLIKDTVGSALLLWMLKIGVIESAGPPDWTRRIRFIVEQGFPWAVLVCLVILAGNLYLVFQTTRKNEAVGVPATSNSHPRPHMSL